jgi:flagellar basal body-associated protein FliL
MAEDQETDEELSSEEVGELDRLLEGEDGEELAKGKIQKLFANKKLLIIIGVLLLAILAGVVFFFLQKAKEPEVVPLVDKVNEEIPNEKEEEKEEIKIAKVNIYKLEPFFLPLLDEDQETDEFISISVNFLLSNSVLGREIDKILPLLRNNIYKILKRKRPSDFSLKRSQTEKKIKKEILTASNALLLSGSGTIKDVFLPHFIIK